MKAANKYTTILFDLDGTLTDPKIGITESIRYALAKLGIVEDDVEKMCQFIGPPLLESFQKYYGFDVEKAKRAIGYYREYFSETGIFENKMYCGIKNLLHDLNEGKVGILLATSKPRIYARRILDYFAIAHYFTGIEGSELDGRLSNKADLIQHALAKYDLLNEETVMIGDRKHDIIGAQKNQIDSVAVGYGYGTTAELMNANPTHYAESIDTLAGMLLGR